MSVTEGHDVKNKTKQMCRGTQHICIIKCENNKKMKEGEKESKDNQKIEFRQMRMKRGSLIGEKESTADRDGKVNMGKSPQMHVINYYHKPTNNWDIYD